MPVARFGQFPPLKCEGYLGIADPRFRTLKKHYYSLPKPIQKLFSFNTRKVAYQQLGSWLMDGLPHGGTCYDVSDEKPLIILTPDGIEQENVYKLLVHEMSHTLDPCRYRNFSGLGFSTDHFPDWIDSVIIYRRWREILAKEPRSTEMSNSFGSRARRNWMKRRQEQWACRMGITLIADYLVPAGLVKANDVALDSDLSVREFKSKWPKSYKFFHEYIGTILRHASKI